MIYNRISVSFGDRKKIKGPTVSYQYDVVQFLIFNGIELPEYYVVDFCNVGDAQTISMTGTSSGVQIPDQLLQTGLNIIAYIVVEGTDEGASETRFEVELPVRQRPERSDIQPEPATQQQIDALIAAMNDAVDASEASAGAAAGSASDADAAAGRAATSEANAKNSELAAKQSEDNAKDSENATSAYATAAEASKINAAESERNAKESEENAEDAADRAEQAAVNAGYMFFYIDENGDLIYQRTSNVQVDFYLSAGDLYVKAVG